MIPGTPDLLTRAEAAAVLGVNPRGIGRNGEYAELRSVWTPGGRRRFLAEDVNRLAESRVTKAGGDAT